MNVPAVSFDRITKRFPGAIALEDVSVEIASGSCHALCGENGAGKSTLAKILAGIHAPDSGRVVLHGEPVRFSNPTQALAAGVAMVHQELSFCENLSVAENLCLGTLPSIGGFVSRSVMRRRAEAMLGAIGANIDTGSTVRDLTVGQQQMVQIAAAIDRGARVVIFDEPTSSLSEHEAGRLYDLIGKLRRQGVTSIYVSHRLEEIFRLCDMVTILRDGRHVATTPTPELDQSSLVEMMIGRRLDEYFPAHVRSEPGRELLRVEGFSGPAGFQDVSFTLRAGEVLGFAGLIGAGRSEVVRAIFGTDSWSSGRLWIRGEPARPRSPRDAIALGIGLVPEDRKRQGLVLSMSAVANGTLSILKRIGKRGFLRASTEEAAIRPYVERLRIQARPGTAAAAMSGGNQQKVVLTKWLAARCPILIVDEPTRGVDVGAKAEIHGLIDELAAGGTAIILVSSEMPELLNLSTRILVFRGGRIVGEVRRADANPDVLMRLMAGVAA